MLPRKTSATYALERRIFFLLSLALVVLISLYLFLITASVFHVMVRKESEQNIALLYSDISTLESEYLTRKGAIDLPMAAQLGFLPTGEKHFAAKQSVFGKGLTLNE